MHSPMLVKVHNNDPSGNIYGSVSKHDMLRTLKIVVSGFIVCLTVCGRATMALSACSVQAHVEPA